MVSCFLKFREIFRIRVSRFVIIRVTPLESEMFLEGLHKGDTSQIEFEIFHDIQGNLGVTEKTIHLAQMLMINLV